MGCAVKSCICSVCGKELGKSECSHVRGGVYDGRLCYGELQNPTDAYEWSFVAVPAQKNAGITKKFGFSADSDANRQLTFLKNENERLKGLAKSRTAVPHRKADGACKSVCRRVSVTR